MNDFIFNEHAEKNAPRLLLCGFTHDYGEMLAAVLSPVFTLCIENPDLIIADENTPVNEKNVPVIVLGKSEAKRKNRVFLRRPVSLAGLRETALSLVSQNTAEQGGSDIVHINEESRTVSLGGKTVSLTALEYRLFSLLYESDEPVSRETVKEKLWPDHTDSNVCDVYICYLRKKLESIFGRGFIVSVRGRGYMLRLL